MLLIVFINGIFGVLPVRINLVKQPNQVIKERNGSVNIFCRGMNYRSDHLVACNELVKMGCVIYGDVFNHSKGIISKDNGMIFTANIDGQHGLTNGFEVGYLMR